MCLIYLYFLNLELDTVLRFYMKQFKKLSKKTVDPWKVA